MLAPCCHQFWESRPLRFIFDFEPWSWSTIHNAKLEVNKECEPGGQPKLWCHIPVLCWWWWLILTQWRCVLIQDYLANDEMEKGTVQDVKRRWALLRMKPDNGKTEAGKHWLGINMRNVVNTGRILKSEKVFSVEFLWFTLLRYEIQQPAHPQVDHTICCITVKLKSI